MSLYTATTKNKTVTVDSMESKMSNDYILKDKDITQSLYNPSDEEKEVLAMVKDHMRQGYTTMFTPRVEFNDLAVIERDQVDQMSWNTYQPNNGQPATADTMSWRSNAIRPVVRNKSISIAAHATARLIYPKVFAYNESSDQQQDAAQVMRDLIEWACDQCDYTQTSLLSVITALYSPASIIYFVPTFI